MPTGEKESLDATVSVAKKWEGDLAQAPLKTDVGIKAYLDCFEKNIIFSIREEKAWYFRELQKYLKVLPNFIEPVFIVDLLNTEDGVEILRDLIQLANCMPVLLGFLEAEWIIKILKTGEGLRKLQFLVACAGEKGKAEFLFSAGSYIRETALATIQFHQFEERINHHLWQFFCEDLKRLLLIEEADEKRENTENKCENDQDEFEPMKERDCLCESTPVTTPVDAMFFSRCVMFRTPSPSSTSSVESSLSLSESIERPSFFNKN
ncbi:MAG: hypothetical protein HY939_07475 [Gammaproteobacteria bacterium]|nr:hypothetical protein [Gammaproteobacteria bacterium]